MILRNNEKTEVLLVDYNHILLKTGDNELELSPRRLEIALNEIKDRKLNIEVIEEETVKKRGNTNASKIENKGKATE
jgi:hypothetical protein|nr:MAG TPA: hypothetical protein [Caudoviricetes sp.]DAP89158.1 MAG TPA: hypothetical protein [Caudoviricetes sp.]DAX34154.1 MAG TPA: hypothetical protein [Caudoviricetes sp.]